MHAGMTEIHARMHDMRRIPPHRAHARIRRASLCTPDRSNVPTNETSGAESKCWRQSTHRGQNLNHTCTRATRTRHRPGAPSSKGRPTRTSRLFRGSESGDSIWLLEAPAGGRLLRLLLLCFIGGTHWRSPPNPFTEFHAPGLVNRFGQHLGPNLGAQISDQKSVHRFVSKPTMSTKFSKMCTGFGCWRRMLALKRVASTLKSAPILVILIFFNWVLV